MENLPKGFKDNDSYKDSQGAGLLERLTDIICDELDNEVLPKLEGAKYLTSPMDITKIPGANYEGLLSYIGWLWGSIPYITFQDLETYQIYLGYAIWIHKNRGNIKAINMFLSLFGLEVNLDNPRSYQSLRVGKSYRYDEPNRFYDTDIIYDYNTDWGTGGCTNCAKEYILITMAKGANYRYYDREFLEHLTKVIENYLVPINVELEIDIKISHGIVTRLERKIKTISQKLISSRANKLND